MRVKQFFSKYGMHAFLLPFFFVLHSYLQYYGLVSVRTAMEVLLKILFFALLFFLLIRLIMGNSNRSLQFTTLTLFIVLFFGVFKDFLTETLHFPFAAKYTVLLPLTGIGAAILYRMVAKKKVFSRLNLFENLLLLACIASDLLPALFARDHLLANRSLLVKKNRVNMAAIPLPAKRPDVYYLIFDCYPGSAFLQQYLHFDNKTIDSSLAAKGFYIAANPKSNYNRTAFSIASELNAEYLDGIENNGSPSPKAYNQALYSIRHAAVPGVFAHLGYKIYNLSIFNMAGQQPMFRENFLSASEQDVLLYNTLFRRLMNDIGWNFTTGRFAGIFSGRREQQKPVVLTGLALKNDYNNRIIDSLPHIPRDSSSSPKFVYAHFYLPHPPFFYDENGKKNDAGIILDSRSFYNGALFLSYLKYTNKVMNKLLDSILARSAGPPIIIVQGDHGFTDFDNCPDDHRLHFKNYSAFYFPDRDYSMLYDTISNINTFPVVWNKYFNMHIPLQKDTSVFTLF